MNYRISSFVRCYNKGYPLTVPILLEYVFDDPWSSYKILRMPGTFYLPGNSIRIGPSVGEERDIIIQYVVFLEERLGYEY